MKIGIKQTGLYNNLPPVFSLTVIDEQGNEKEKLLPSNEYLQIVAASNFKQRSRMSMLYYHAEAMHRAVIGTPNKHEQEQGFFVKYGDGGADVMPIGNLYKTQVYQLAEYLGIPESIIKRTPTTDTYSATQTQEEFFYQLKGDMLLKLHDTGTGEFYDVPIREGDIFLLPAHIRHSPQRPQDGSIGLVIEPARPEGALDAIEWYCFNCHARVHRAEVDLESIVDDLPPIYAAFYADESARTCPSWPRITTARSSKMSKASQSPGPGTSLSCPTTCQWFRNTPSRSSANSSGAR